MTVTMVSIFNLELGRWKNKPFTALPFTINPRYFIKHRALARFNGQLPGGSSIVLSYKRREDVSLIPNL